MVAIEEVIEDTACKVDEGAGADVLCNGLRLRTNGDGEDGDVAEGPLHPLDVIRGERCQVDAKRVPGRGVRRVALETFNRAMERVLDER